VPEPLSLSSTFLVIVCGGFKRLGGEMLRELAEEFERGELVATAEEGMNLIRLDWAVGAYAGE